MVEKSLSVDNLFVFLIIMGRFAVPAQYQQKVLLFGIMAALGMRRCLSPSARRRSTCSPNVLLFGLLLIWTAIQLVRPQRRPGPGR